MNYLVFRLKLIRNRIHAFFLNIPFKVLYWYGKVRYYGDSNGFKEYLKTTVLPGSLHIDEATSRAIKFCGALSKALDRINLPMERSVTAILLGQWLRCEIEDLEAATKIAQSVDLVQRNKAAVDLLVYFEDLTQRKLDYLLQTNPEFKTWYEEKEH